uniref:Zinc-finger domain-containing protein n=1 Tax=Auxenochlorella protothecoides TaxID=3075 RepID=A0A1D1ZUA6_AUXPR
MRKSQHCYIISTCPQSNNYIAIGSPDVLLRSQPLHILQAPGPFLRAMLSEYELQRQARIAANKARMDVLGLKEATSQVQMLTAPRRIRAPPAAGCKAAPRERPQSSRRSARVAGNPAVVYNESDLARAGLAEEERTKHDRRLLKENIREEVYGVQHLSALGSHTKEWTLFEDGYDKSGNRIYDKVSGQTCHQCRQKTLGLRTHCSECQSLHGVFCGDCLFMRYGENVEEALQDSEWKCPGCRDLCNCSFHRSRRGWAPTGTLYRRAVAEGFVSVAHYLVLNNLAPEARSAALPLMPKELADATRAELEREAAGCDRRSASPAGPATPCASGEAAQDRAAQRPQAPGEEEASASPSPARPSGEEAGEAPTGRRRGARRQSTLRSDVLGAVVKTGGMIAAGKPGAGKRAGGTGKAAPAVERVGRGLRTSSRLVAGRA